jgi:transposase
MKHERIEQEILFDHHSPLSTKRMALTILLQEKEVAAETISWVVGVSERQVRNYRKAHEKRGVFALTPNSRYRPVSELKAYEDIIRESLVTAPVATASEACERIERLTGIKRSPTQVRAFMRGMGLKPLKVASIPAKANPTAQSEFLEKQLEPKIKEAENGKRALLFMDSAHFVWRLYLGVLWCMSRIFIQAASGRIRTNVLGAYDPIKNELIKIVNRTYITSVTVIELLEMIRAAYLDTAVTIVLDNARYQRCKAVIEKAAALNIELLFLPTYSPNLNLIERLWRFVKKDCLYSKHYSTANEFETAILNCLEQINTTKKHKIESLMTLKFQLFDVHASVPSNEPLLKTA